MKEKIIVRCFVCCKALIGRTPKGGDGSLWIPNIHWVRGAVCEGSYNEAHILTNQDELVGNRERLMYSKYLTAPTGDKSDEG